MKKTIFAALMLSMLMIVPAMAYPDNLVEKAIVKKEAFLLKTWTMKKASRLQITVY